MANFSARQTGNGQFNAVFGEIVFGLQGKAGEDGKDFVILGYYDSVSELESAVKSPNPGDSYCVGSSSPFDVYTWDGVGKRWVNNGPLAVVNRFGLGASCVEITDWNTAVKNGWYKTTTHDPNNNSPDGYAWFGHVDSYADYLVVQTAYHMNSDTEYLGARRFFRNDVWSPWAYFQYPIKPGVEYRTAEMFGGKYVYVKAINMGNLAQGKINVAHGITNFSRAVRFSGSCSNSTCIPTELFYGQSNNYIRAYMNATYATLEVNAPDVSDVTPITATLVMYYTKSID